MPVDIMREESGNEPVAAFSMSHPAVPALYTALTLGLTMFSMQPVLIALSLDGRAGIRLCDPRDCSHAGRASLAAAGDFDYRAGESAV